MSTLSIYEQQMMMANAVADGAGPFLDNFTGTDGTFDDTRVPDSGVYLPGTSGEIVSNRLDSSVLDTLHTLVVSRSGTVTMHVDATIGAQAHSLSLLHIFPRYISPTSGIFVRLTDEFRRGFQVVRLSDMVVILEANFSTSSVPAGTPFSFDITDDGSRIDATLDIPGFGNVSNFIVDLEATSATECRVTDYFANTANRKIYVDQLSVDV